MLNVSQVWSRVRKLPDFKGVKESDLRHSVYDQIFTPPDDQTITAFSPRVFPVGGIVIGINASATIPGVSAAGQCANNRQAFALDFQYTGGEALTVDGPICADALMGSGEMSQYPAKELILPTNQQIKCRAQNLIGASAPGMLIHVAYHLLTWRYAG
jgi:hypothetical protein